MVEVRTAKDFSELIEKLDPKNEEHKIALETIIKNYPYFQTPFIFYLKLLKEVNHYDYQKSLNKAALLTNNRKILRLSVDERKFAKNNASKINSTTNNRDHLKLSFIEWIKLGQQENSSENNSEDPIYNKINLIDNFLENNPRLTSIRDDSEKVNFELENVFSPEELMTETLAKIFLKQKKYKKALKAYNILSLKYPEKNAFFAIQIKKIKDLQKEE